MQDKVIFDEIFDTQGIFKVILQFSPKIVFQALWQTS